MRESLRNRLETQVRIEKALQKGHRLEFEQVIKLGAMLYANTGRDVDAGRIKECKRILKEKAGIFSNFRGTLAFVVQIKMALADEPRAYLDGVMAVYERLKAGRKLPGELLAMAATTIYDNCPQNKIDETVERTLEAYAHVKERHRFLTDDADMALIALMVMAGKDPDQAAEQAEELYGTLREHLRIGSDTAQTVAMVLALSSKPAAQKIEDFVALYEACKEARHATSRDNDMAIYAAFADVDYDLAELVSEIGEVDVWLKGQKGYGAFGVGGSMRRMLAATFVLEDRQGEMSTPAASTAHALVQAVVEEVVLIIVTIIFTSVVISATASSSHS